MSKIERSGDNLSRIIQGLLFVAVLAVLIAGIDELNDDQERLECQGGREIPINWVTGDELTLISEIVITRYGGISGVAWEDKYCNERRYEMSGSGVGQWREVGSQGKIEDCGTELGFKWGLGFPEETLINGVPGNWLSEDELEVCQDSEGGWFVRAPSNVER